MFETTVVSPTIVPIRQQDFVETDELCSDNFRTTRFVNNNEIILMTCIVAHYYSTIDVLSSS